MKAHKAKMYSVDFSRLRIAVPHPFPLYLFLPQNERMVRLTLAGAPLEEALYTRLAADGCRELWVPEEFASTAAPFLTEAPGPASAGQSSAEIAADASAEDLASAEELAPREEATTPEEAPGARPTEETAASPEEASAQENSLPEKSPPLEAAPDELRALGHQLLAELSSIREAGDPARRAFAERSHRAVSDVLSRAANENGRYEELLRLRNLQNPSEHSTFVGNLAAATALAIGHTEPQWVADLVLAATFHDVGLPFTVGAFYARPRPEWSDDENAAYEKHVEVGAALLENSETAFPAAALRMVREHHERTESAQTNEGGRILAWANFFDALCRGAETGTALSPNAAGEFLRAEGESRGLARAVTETFLGMNR